MIAEVEMEFGKTTDLPVKLRIAAAGIKKLDAGMRRDFNTAIGAEVECLRDGVFSAVVWQCLNPDALGAREPLFQRLLDSHTPETMQGGVTALLAKPVRAVLASSPVTLNGITSPGHFQRISSTSRRISGDRNSPRADAANQAE